jgi:HK97 family phage major capsid protein
MASEAFMKVRTMLGGGVAANASVISRNTTGAMNHTTAGDAGGVEVQKTVSSMIKDAFSRDTEFRQLVRREGMAPGNLVHTWVVETALASNVVFYDEGDAAAPSGTSRAQLFNPAKALRADYEVSGLLIAGGFFDVLGKEARNALSKMNLVEEQAFINGSDANVGVTGSYPGLLQLMLNNGDHGDTASTYGVTRAGAATAYVEVQAVDAGTTGTATGVLDLADLDSAITKAEKQKLGGRKIFLCSFERADEINQLLQPQQRFMGSIEIAAGFRVMTYRGIPVVRSKRMAYNGVTNTGGANNSTDADNAMYLLDLDEISFRSVGGVDQVHVPIYGIGDTTAGAAATGYSRADAVGGFYKTYGCFAMERFDCQVIIWNLTAP